MKQYLNCKKVETAINRATKLLIERADKKGIYENFGQEEVRNIKDHFHIATDYSPEGKYHQDLILQFDHWCSSYAGSRMRESYYGY